MSSETFAVIDMGSNSFHLLIAARQGASWTPLQRQERKVQLADGRRGSALCPAAQARALACLAGYMDCLDRYYPCHVRIVATASLRGADCEPFLQQVQRCCGVRPRILSGDEEASLIYLGVSSEVEAGQPALVVDVGGGSTELALGQGQELREHRSVEVGCLSYLHYFPGECLEPDMFAAAARAAAAQFLPFAAKLPSGPLQVWGSSGSLLAIEQVLQTLGRSRGGIHLQDLRWLGSDITRFQTLAEVRYGGLSEDRQRVFASGVAIALALFETLGLERMALSKLGLREGVMAAWLSESSVSPI